MGWSDIQVFSTYYGAIIGFVVLMLAGFVFLRPEGAARSSGPHGTLMLRGFYSTLVMAGVLGVLSISVKSCDGEFVDLSGQPELTINIGLSELAAGCNALAEATGVWFGALSVVRLFTRRPTRSQWWLTMSIVVVVSLVLYLMNQWNAV